MSSPPRLFVPKEHLVAGRLSLAVGDQHRLVHVLRLSPGAAVQLFDGAGQRAVACLQQDGHSLEVQPPTAAREALPALLVAVGMPSAERSDWLIEKLVELGATRIVPLHCARSQGGAQRAAMDRRQARWERLAVAAARQAERWVVPQIAPLQPLDELPAAPPQAACFVAVPGAAASSAPPATAPRHLVVGPPGGLTDAELGDLAARGYTSMGLGPHVLRTETAALCATSLLLHGPPT